MDIIESQELTDQISRIVRASIPSGWVSGKVFARARTDRLLEVGGSYIDRSGNTITWTDVPDEAGHLLIRLRKGMASSPKDRWREAVLTFNAADASSQTQFVYDD